MSNLPIKPDYLGDAVYATHTPENAIRLTTEDHRVEFANNSIWLEPDVMIALINYAIRAGIYTPPATK